MDERYAVVIPTTGRRGLRGVLAALDGPRGPAEVVVVDDRPTAGWALPLPEISVRVRVLRSGGRGPAAARNAGWRAVDAPWVVFLDDDVLPGPEWTRRMARDLRGLSASVAGSQARISVALPENRAPTDAERGTAGLARAWWITADMAYRRRVLAELDGFDERFPRAYREDADMAMRVRAAGYDIVQGSRRTEHPTPRERFFSSVRAQAGNADNALMRRKYGRRWRQRIGEGPGRIRGHLVTTTAGTVAATGVVRRRWRPMALVGAAVWLASTVEFAWRRVAPGPRTLPELSRMAVTSVLIPPVACAHRAKGELRSRSDTTIAAVLFDRDGTLIHDVPYNGDPARVHPIAGVREALNQVRENGLALGLISNQSGVARGLIDEDQVRAVNRAVERELGPFGTWQVCVHGEHDGCECRKPAPGLVRRAAEALGVAVASCVVIGDTGADVDAAIAAGARGILVPTYRTLPEEIRRAHEYAEVARTVTQAVARVVAS